MAEVKEFGFVWPSTSRPIGGVGVLYEYANALARRGHRVNFVHGPAWPGRIGSVEEIEWFTFEHDVVHHVVDSLDDPALPNNDVVFAQWLPERLGLPAAIIQGDGMLGNGIERHILRARSPKVCVASWLVEVGLGHGVPAEQLRTIVPGFDKGRFRFDRPLDDRPTDVAVLCHPHPAKGWSVAVKALAQLGLRRPGLRVETFGADDEHLERPDWMEHRGPLHPDALAELYGRAKIVLQPSWYEGFGLTAVEGMACGAALVTTRNGGSEEYTRPGSAITVEPGDVDAMAATLGRLLENDRARVDMARRGIRVVERFDWDLAASTLEDFMVEYLADPSRFQRPPAPHAEPDFAYEIGFGTFDRRCG